MIMARFGGTYPGEWRYQVGEDWRAYDARTDKMFAELIARSEQVDLATTLVDVVVRFPIADGFAHYIVTADRPLTLQHIPVGDAWTIPEAHLRGLRAQDIRRDAERDRHLAKLFPMFPAPKKDGE